MDSELITFLLFYLISNQSKVETEFQKAISWRLIVKLFVRLLLKKYSTQDPNGLFVKEDVILYSMPGRDELL